MDIASVATVRLQLRLPSLREKRQRPAQHQAAMFQILVGWFFFPIFSHLNEKPILESSTPVNLEGDTVPLTTNQTHWDIETLKIFVQAVFDVVEDFYPHRVILSSEFTRRTNKAWAAITTVMSSQLGKFFCYFLFENVIQ